MGNGSPSAGVGRLSLAICRAPGAPLLRGTPCLGGRAFISRLASSLRESLHQPLGIQGRPPRPHQDATVVGLATRRPAVPLRTTPRPERRAEPHRAGRAVATARVRQCFGCRGPRAGPALPGLPAAVSRVTTLHVLGVFCLGCQRSISAPRRDRWFVPPPQKNMGASHPQHCRMQMSAVEIHDVFQYLLLTHRRNQQIRAAALGSRL